MTEPDGTLLFEHLKNSELLGKPDELLNNCQNQNVPTCLSSFAGASLCLVLVQRKQAG